MLNCHYLTTKKTFLIFLQAVTANGDLEDVVYNPSIEISDGQIVGTYGETSNGTKYVAFKGIPYAQPPIGNLRFAVSFVHTG